MGPLQGAHISITKAFCWPVFAHPSDKWCPFLSVTKVIKLEYFQRLASCPIAIQLLSYPTPSYFFSAVPASSLRVAQTHLALRLSTSPISSLSRHEVKSIFQVLLESHCDHLRLFPSSFRRLFSCPRSLS